MKIKFFIPMSLLLAFVISFASCSSNSASATAKAMMSDMQAGKYEKIADYMYLGNMSKEEAERTKEFITKMMANSGTKQIENKGGIKSFSVKNETIEEDGNKATIEMEVVYGNGDTETQRQKLIKVDGKWYADAGK